MDKKYLTNCPVCVTPLTIRALECPTCSTRIEGTFHFLLSNLFNLPEEDLEFIELFIRVRGNIREMEKVLGVSYPTVRSKLDKVIHHMGDPRKKAVDPEARKAILEKLDRGDISREEAEKQFQEEAPPSE